MKSRKLKNLENYIELRKEARKYVEDNWHELLGATNRFYGWYTFPSPNPKDIISMAGGVIQLKHPSEMDDAKVKIMENCIDFEMRRRHN